MSVWWSRGVRPAVIGEEISSESEAEVEAALDMTAETGVNIDEE